MPGLLDSPYLDPRVMAGRGLPNAQSSPRAMTAAASFVPGVGDAIGLLSDAAGYVQDPKSLTLGSGLLSLAAMAPGVPRKPPKAIQGAWARYNEIGSPRGLLEELEGLPKIPAWLKPHMQKYRAALDEDFKWAGRWDIGPEEDAFLNAVGSRVNDAADIAPSANVGIRASKRADGAYDWHLTDPDGKTLETFGSMAELDAKLAALGYRTK